METIAVVRRPASKLTILAAIAGAALLVAPAQATARDFELGGKRCELIAVPAAAPVGVGGCDGVRPGALVESKQGFCTLNFLFRGSDGRRYIGTAGHCVIGESSFGGEDAGERSWKPGDGPRAKDADGDRIGRFAYAVLRNEKDFALIRLKDGVDPNARMCHFGGPTGVHDGRPSRTVTLNHYGNGLGVGDVLPARSMIAQGMPDPDHVFAQGVVVPGDSGGPVIFEAGRGDGRSVGLTVTTGVHASAIGTDGVDAGTVGITRLPPQRDRAEKVLGLGLSLKQAPLR